jgi:hypothetical protein
VNATGDDMLETARDSRARVEAELAELELASPHKSNRKITLPWTAESLYPVPNIENHGTRNLGIILSGGAELRSACGRYRRGSGYVARAVRLPERRASKASRSTSSTRGDRFPDSGGQVEGDHLASSVQCLGTGFREDEQPSQVFDGEHTEIKRSSQHRYRESRCFNQREGDQIARCEPGCTHRVVHPWHVERIGNVSGSPSPRA